MGGDLDWTAIGTVTHREGDRLLVFGHPFLDTGKLSAPMTAAYVHGIVPSLQFSFKLAGGMDQLGAFVYDRGTVVVGRMGAACDMVPCQVIIRRKDTGRTYQYNYSLLRHRRITGLLAGVALASSYERTEPELADTMAQLTMTLTIKGRKEPVVAQELFFDEGMMSWTLFDAGMLVRLLTENPFCTAEIEEARFALEVERGRRTAQIHSLQLERETVAAGKPLTVTVGLKPYRSAELVEKKVVVQVPENVPPGTSLEVIACDAGTAEDLKRRHSPGTYHAENLDQLIELIGQVEHANDLIIFVALPRTGVSYQGRALPDLPASLVRAMASSIQSGVGPVVDAMIERVPTDWVLRGEQSMTVGVTRKGK
jgi:hypothetical protein